MKREEQIRLAQQLLESGVLSEESANAIKADFPELAESEDERIRKGLLDIFSQSQNGYWAGMEIKDIVSWLEKQKEQKPAEWSEDIIRKAVKEVGLTQHQINWFENNVFPPKQEWSEEDEKMLTGIIERGSSHVPPFEPALREEQMEWLMNRLKSLRPQPHWKPSEKQMAALEYALGNGGKYDKEALKSLYEQLKKL